MSSWRTVRIGELGRVVTGKTPPAAQPEMFCGNIPFITPSDMYDDARHIIADRHVSAHWDPKRRLSLPEQAICVVCIGATIGKVCMTDRPSHTNQQINSIIVDQAVFDPRFIYYTMRTKTDALRSRAAGAATPIINKSIFSDVEISCPDLKTQRRIASILGAYDDLIEVNRRRVAVLEEMARGLFEEWFVRFRFPGHENLEIVETPDGPFPEWWTWGILGDLLQLEYGKALKADQRVPGCVTVFGSGGNVGQHNKALVEGPGIIVGRKGNVGAVIWSRGDFWPIDTVFYVRSTYPLTYLFHLLKLQPFQNTDAAVPGLNRAGALKIPVAIPPLDICEGYNRRVEPVFKLRDMLLEQNRALAASRDLLLPRLISGQLLVEAAEKKQEMAA